MCMQAQEDGKQAQEDGKQAQENGKQAQEYGKQAQEYGKHDFLHFPSAPESAVGLPTADHLLENGGKKFIELMTRLTVRRPQILAAKYQVVPPSDDLAGMM